MKKIYMLLAVLIVMVSFLAACNNGKVSETSVKETDTTRSTLSNPQIKEEIVSYSADTETMKSYIAYDASTDKKRPIVLVIPEWWGLNDYSKGRAKQLASMGYLAMAVDVYGNGAIADNPDLAGKMATPFYTNPAFAKGRFDAALAKAKSYAIGDTTKIAAIGYCFGGALVLNMARLGENLKGVVSFHGNLVGVPADKKLLKAEVLVCHGEADKFISNEEVAQFKKQMDSIGHSYTFKSYPNATHAFTNPAATETGKKFSMPIEYNAAADSASWNEMKEFFGKIFR
ncbi:MAG: dienelactone hydrolase family protein [Ferruginibacter sp.]